MFKVGHEYVEVTTGDIWVVYTSVSTVVPSLVDDLYDLFDEDSQSIIDAWDGDSQLQILVDDMGRTRLVDTADTVNQWLDVTGLVADVQKGAAIVFTAYQGFQDVGVICLRCIEAGMHPLVQVELGLAFTRATRKKKYVWLRRTQYGFVSVPPLPKAHKAE